MKDKRDLTNIGMGGMSASADELCGKIDALEEWKASAEIEIEKYKSDLIKQEKFLWSINDIARSLLAAKGDIGKVACECLEVMGTVTGLGKVCIWKNLPFTGGKYRVESYEWDNGKGHTFGKKEFGMKPYDKITSFREAIDSNTCLNRLVRQMSGWEREYFESKGIKAVFMVPIKMKGAPWGIMGGYNYTSEEVFSEPEENTLIMSGFLLASAIERKTFESRLRDMEDISQVILNSTPLCCNLWDRDYQNIFCNDEAVRLFDMPSRQEYLDRFFELSPEFQPCGESSSDLAFKQITKAFDEGYNRFEWQHQKLNGDPVPSEVTLVRIEYKGDYIVAGYTRDLREFNSMLLEMRKKDELRVAMKKAVAQSKAKSEFLARMSHEIRTPMNAIVGMTELMLRDDISSTAREHAVAIKHASANLLSIINDILDLSKIESGKLEILENNYTLSSMLNDVINIIRIRVMEKPIRFLVNIDAALPNNLLGDELRVRQALLNILSNAAKYTKEGHISLTVSGQIAEAGSVLLTFAVEDSGIGIKQKDMNTLFSEFVRMDALKNRGVEGTGLGLAITRSLCKAMGGNIDVKSTYGTGSLFTISFPQKVTDSAAVASLEDTHIHSVLVYDQRPICAESMQKAVSNLGAKCVAVHNQPDFYKALKAATYTCIFMPATISSSVLGPVKAMQLPSKIVLMAETDKAATANSYRTVSMPLHAISVANILNDVECSDTNFMGSQDNIRFVAPNARILLVDDIVTNLKVAEGLMAPYEMRIDLCDCGQDAVDLVKVIDYDIVFMDHMMPEMDGVQATLEIRKAEALANKNSVPIVALTANAVSGMKDFFLANGFSDFLAKPMDMKRLGEILDRWVSVDKKLKYVPVGDRNMNDDVPIDIKNVDVKKGITMTGGTLEQYLKVLIEFRKDSIKKRQEIEICLTGGNLKLYTIYVHALKSAFANIGATKMSDLSKSLEFAAKGMDFKFMEEKTPDLLRGIDELVAGIDDAMAKSVIYKEEADVPSDWLNSELTRLREALLELDTMTADAIINGLTSKQLGEDTAHTLEKISWNILMCDYDEAGELIDRLVKPQEQS